MAVTLELASRSLHQNFEQGILLSFRVHSPRLVGHLKAYDEAEKL